MRKYFIIACISGFLAVALGAMGAHALRDKISEVAAAQYKTAVDYQFYHTLALLAFGLLFLHKSEKHFIRSAFCFALGMFLFSGSIYLLATREVSGWTGIGSILGPVTPLGGIFLMAGWIFGVLGVMNVIRND